MEQLKSPLKSGTKDYLMKQIVPTLIEGLTQLSIMRPGDPHKFLASYLLKKSSSPEKLVILTEAEIEALRGTSIQTERAAGSAVKAARALSSAQDGTSNQEPQVESEHESQMECQTEPEPEPNEEANLPELEPEPKLEPEPQVEVEIETPSKMEKETEPELEEVAHSTYHSQPLPETQDASIYDSEPAPALEYVDDVKVTAVNELEREQEAQAVPEL